MIHKISTKKTFSGLFSGERDDAERQTIVNTEPQSIIDKAKEEAIDSFTSQIKISRDQASREIDSYLRKDPSMEIESELRKILKDRNSYNAKTNLPPILDIYYDENKEKLTLKVDKVELGQCDIKKNGQDLEISINKEDYSPRYKIFPEVLIDKIEDIKAELSSVINNIDTTSLVSSVRELFITDLVKNEINRQVRNEEFLDIMNECYDNQPRGKSMEDAAFAAFDRYFKTDIANSKDKGVEQLYHGHSNKLFDRNMSELKSEGSVKNRFNMAFNSSKIRL
jgi:hypothetical protein